MFAAGYVPARLLIERFREPDALLGFLFGAVTMGELLSLPMLLAGRWLIVPSRRVDAARRA